MHRTVLAVAIMIVSVILLSVGCGYKSEAAYEEEVYAPQGEAAKSSLGSSSERMAAEPEARDTEGDWEKDSLRLASLEEEEAQPDEEERKRVYSGYARLMVDSVDRTKDELSNLAEEAGGYVESVYEQTVVIRVPAELFESVFERIQGMGEVLHKSVETVDVTEYYSDLASRLMIAERTRARLYGLLERTEDVEERLRILREIRRLTEEIEKINLTLELLDRRIALSRVVVELQPRLGEEAESREEIPFPWIAALDPLYPSLEPPKRGVTLELGDEFAVFKRVGLIPFSGPPLFRAESFDGTRVRIGSTENDPKGDSEFWQRALVYHLSPFYRETESLVLEKVRAVLLKSKDREPFYYLVGVQTKGDVIHVVEVFFPDEKTFQARVEEIKRALSGMEEI